MAECTSEFSFLMIAKFKLGPIFSEHGAESESNRSNLAQLNSIGDLVQFIPMYRLLVHKQNGFSEEEEEEEEDMTLRAWLLAVGVSATLAKPPFSSSLFFPFECHDSVPEP